MTLRTTAIGALVVSIGVGMLSNILFLTAFQFRLDVFLAPELLVSAGPLSGNLLRWAAALDLIGYYLATAVLAYVLWRHLRHRSALVADLATMAALGYAIAGGAGAAVLAMLGPMLMDQHAASTAPLDQTLIVVQFSVLIEVVWRSIWQFLDGVLISLWWLGVGLLVRDDQPGLSRLSRVLAAAAAIGVVLNIVGLELLRDLSLSVVFTLWTAWWLWLLALFIRRKAPFQQLES